MIARVDDHAVKFNQAATMVLIVIAFALNQPWLILLTCLVMVVGLVRPAIGPFHLLYQGVFVAAGIMKPQIEDEDPAPHRFATGMGATVLALSAVLLLGLKVEVVGWALALIVAALAAISAFANF
ncbi:DUF4395 family protein [Chloroflexota bacterium]